MNRNSTAVNVQALLKEAGSSQQPATPAPTPLIPTRAITPQDIKSLRLWIRSWLVIPTVDNDIVDFILAVYLSQQMPGDPLWGMVVDASGGGKTELLRAFEKEANSYFLTRLTDKTLISGYRDPKNPKDLSILPDLHGKVLIVKDLAPMLQMPADKRKAIFSQLRDAYDGFSDSGSGMTGKVSYKSRFSFLAACTESIESFPSMEQELGERTVKFRTRDASDRGRELKAMRAGRIGGQEDEMRADLQRVIHEFVTLSIPVPKQVSRIMQQRIAKLADFTAKARSYVARDRAGDVLRKPKAEYGTRLNKELTKLLKALAAIRAHPEPNEQDFATVQRVAEDSLPPNRLAVIRFMQEEEPAPVTVGEVKDAIDLPEKIARQALEDLTLLRIVTAKKVEGVATKYNLAASITVEPPKPFSGGAAA